MITLRRPAPVTPQPTYAELERTTRDQAVQIAELRAEIRRLRGEVEQAQGGIGLVNCWRPAPHTATVRPR